MSVALYALTQWLGNTLPERLSTQLAEGLADLQYRCADIDRATVQANLRVVLGDPAGEHPQMARDTFRNFVRYLVEFLTVHQNQRLSVTIEGYEHLTTVMRSARGGLLLSAHLGNWELGAVVLRRLGVPISVIALPHQHPSTDALFNRQRTRCGVGVVPLGKWAAQRSVERLRRGELLGILGDREFGTNGLTVSFFGRPTIMPRGPAILSLRTGAPVVPVFFIREGPWRFRFYMEPPMWPPQGPRAHGQVQHFTQRYATILERYIRQFPSQWLMFRPVFGQSTEGMATRAGGPDSEAHSSQLELSQLTVS